MCLTDADRTPCKDIDYCTPPAVLSEIYSLTPPATEFVDTGRRECVGGPGGPTAPAAGDDDLAAEAARQESTLLGLSTPAPVLDPAPTTLVNLATILTAGQGETKQTKDATLLGVPVTLSATPHFHWTLPDLPDITTDDPGTTYDGTNPANDPNHYITATWTTTGTRNLTLTVNWTGTLTRHDTGQTITLPTPITKTATIQVTVKQSRAILTGNS